MSHGIVLGNDGQKMSKSLRNYPDVNEVFDTYGSDAMRWFLMASPVLRGGDLVVTEQGIRDAVRQAILPLWNSWYFFALYANAEAYQAARSVSSEHVLDRYILAKTRAAVTEIETLLDGYNVGAACQALRDHLEVLTNWYIRRSRSRFWAGEPAALDTLWTVLETVTRAAAPLLPLTTEAIWRGLTGGAFGAPGRTGPTCRTGPADEQELAGAMDLVRSVCSTALGLRKAHQLRVRLPLAVADHRPPGRRVAGPVHRADRRGGQRQGGRAVRRAGQPGPVRAGGEPAGTRAPARRAGAAGHPGGQGRDWSDPAQGDRIEAAGVELEPGEYELKLAAADPDSTSALPGNTGLIALDLRVTPELAAEGTARDVVRIVQQARRDAGLAVSDRIRLDIGADGAVADAVRAHAGFIAAETLAVGLEVRPAAEVGGDPHPVADAHPGAVVTVALARVPS